MQRYNNNAQDKLGNALAGATVTVRVQNVIPATGALASLFSDTLGTLGISNPTFTDANGMFGFCVADGFYDITVTGVGVNTITLPNVRIEDYLSTTSKIGILSVKSPPFNAVGDGVADDTVAINAALTAAISLNSAEVIFPYGTYKTSGLLITSYTGQNLAIIGYGARILIGANQVGLAISGSQNIQIKGFSFYSAAQSGASQAGISCTLSARIRILDNDFRVLTYGVNFISSALGIATSAAIQIPSLISRNTFKACAVGIALGGSGSSTAAEYVGVSGNVVNDCTVQGILVQAGNVRVSDNTATGNMIGIEIDGSQYPNADHGAVIGNTINHSSSCGLYVHDTSAQYSYLITGNNIWATIYSNFGAGNYAHPFGAILKNCASINFTNNIMARNTVNLGIDVLTSSLVANNNFLTDSTLTLFNIYEITALTVANGNKMAPNTFSGTLVAGANNNDYEQVYTIGGTGAPAFQNSWANLGAGFDSAAYSKDASGIVHLYGTVAGGSGLNTAIFTLPVTFRPATKKIWAGLSNNLLGAIQIDTAGVVQASVGTTTWQTLSNVSFKAEA